jgi:hypothetical protein
MLGYGFRHVVGTATVEILKARSAVMLFQAVLCGKGGIWSIVWFAAAHLVWFLLWWGGCVLLIESTYFLFACKFHFHSPHGELQQARSVLAWHTGLARVAEL